ncbi:MAG: hypothetical protein JRJ39_07075 [Deltaproteobacteria bacterium]|nr:hypothetical protein [Deltaproteobacteria bacterium]
MIEWNGKEVTNAAVIILGKVTKKVAENVMKDAKRILRRKAKTKSERGLLTQFDIQQSKYKDGGLLVYCQGPDNWHPPYHASFVELGTYKDKKPKHFMRLAYKQNKRKANKMFQDALDKL